jgi:hypothetical protein
LATVFEVIDENDQPFTIDVGESFEAPAEREVNDG